MAQYLNKRRRWSTAKILQYTFAILALLIALGILLTWLFLRYQNGSDTGKDKPVEPVQEETIISTEPTNCLLIFDFEDAERFVLVQANAGQKRITTVPLPATIADADGCTLAEAFHRHGAQSVTKTVSNVLELPLEHYIALTPNGVEQFLSALGSGITFSIPEKVSYVENGATIQLSTGEQMLSPSQVRILLTYTKWKNTEYRTNLAAELTTAVLNQYLVKDRPFEHYFSSLSNVCTTKLRYDNFYAYLPTLQYLAASNDGNLCQQITLPGSKKNGIFTPSLKTFRTDSGLYE